MILPRCFKTSQKEASKLNWRKIVISVSALWKKMKNVPFFYYSLKFAWRKCSFLFLLYAKTNLLPSLIKFQISLGAPRFGTEAPHGINTRNNSPRPQAKQIDRCCKRYKVDVQCELEECVDHRFYFTYNDNFWAQAATRIAIIFDGREWWNVLKRVSPNDQLSYIQNFVSCDS